VKGIWIGLFLNFNWYNLNLPEYQEVFFETLLISIFEAKVYSGFLLNQCIELHQCLIESTEVGIIIFRATNT